MLHENERWRDNAMSEIGGGEEDSYKFEEQQLQ